MLWGQASLRGCWRRRLLARGEQTGGGQIGGGQILGGLAGGRQAGGEQGGRTAAVAAPPPAPPLGVEQGKRVLKKRGRWKSDIHYIYERDGMAESMDASGRVGDVDTLEIEAVFAAWAEPATR